MMSRLRHHNTIYFMGVHILSKKKKKRISNEEYPFHENNYIWGRRKGKGFGNSIEIISNISVIVCFSLSVFLSLFCSLIIKMTPTSQTIKLLKFILI